MMVPGQAGMLKTKTVLSMLNIRASSTLVWFIGNYLNIFRRQNKRPPMPVDSYTPKNAFNLKKAFNHGYTQIYTDTSETYTNKVNHLFVKSLSFQMFVLSVFIRVIRGQLRFLG